MNQPINGVEQQIAQHHDQMAEQDAQEDFTDRWIEEACNEPFSNDRFLDALLVLFSEDPSAMTDAVLLVYGDKADPEDLKKHINRQLELDAEKAWEERNDI